MGNVFKAKDRATLTVDSVTGAEWVFPDPDTEASGNSPDTFNNPDLLRIDCGAVVAVGVRFDGAASFTDSDVATIVSTSDADLIPIPKGARKVSLIQYGGTSNVMHLARGWAR